LRQRLIIQSVVSFSDVSLPADLPLQAAVAALLPKSDAVLVKLLEVCDDGITLVLATGQPAVPCPGCGTLSARVHSRYRRSLADLPWGGVAVDIDLHTRRFFCDQTSCPRQTFSEPLPELVAPYRRRTLRCEQVLSALALALGGEPGARLAARLSLGVSADSLLRCLRRTRHDDAPTPRVLGVDDWAWKKHQRYGTILVDLERHTVVDLLPDRKADTLAEWLRAHPGIAVVARDRAGAYADGILQGAPAATQVADRFHLVMNAREALQRVVHRHQSVLRAAMQPPGEQTVAPASSVEPVKPASAAGVAERERRLARYQEVIRLRQQGAGIAAIAQALRIGPGTVRRYLQAGGFPERHRPRSRPSILDPYIEYLGKRWQEGCHDARQLWREIRVQGFSGSDGLVRRWLMQFKQDLPAALQHGHRYQRRAAVTRMAEAPLTARQVAWLLFRDDLREENDRVFVERVLSLSLELRQATELAREFHTIVRERRSGDLEDWLTRTEQSELGSFAESLRKDLPAVRAALMLPWSNGQTEGQVHRLKLIKRQMYGRAKFDLLAQRVCHAA
jgi:transposase